MKHIGIVVITTVGACICANTIVSEAAKKDASGNHPEYTMHALPFQLYKECVMDENWGKMANLILESIEKLKQSGAEFIIIPSNTPHYGITSIQDKSPLPVLNLIEICTNECFAKKYNKVAILGTKATMTGGLYELGLKEKNIKPVIPDVDLIEDINNLIMDQIIPSRIDPESVLAIAEKIKKLDCDAVLLGCTELPEIYNEKNLGKPVIDTTRLLASIALDFSIGLMPELYKKKHEVKFF